MINQTRFQLRALNGALLAELSPGSAELQPTPRFLSEKSMSVVSVIEFGEDLVGSIVVVVGHLPRNSHKG